MFLQDDTISLLVLNEAKTPLIVVKPVRTTSTKHLPTTNCEIHSILSMRFWQTNDFSDFFYGDENNQRKPFSRVIEDKHEARGNTHEPYYSTPSRILHGI
jgi:hypothetical protein